MVDPAMQPAILKAIHSNELGSASPYCLSFAGLGSSGASFGLFQGDTNVNHTARAVLAQALAAAGVDAATAGRIMAAVGQACPRGNPLSAEDTQAANDALACDAGRALVDKMDGALLQIVLGELDSCIAASARVGQTLAGEAQLYIALWVNMTGAPTTLNAWLSGSTEVGMAPPPGPQVTALQIENYLQANTYFRLHPHNFVHMQQSVQSAVDLLPAPAAQAA
jgi:hypothetical protein